MGIRSGARLLQVGEDENGAAAGERPSVGPDAGPSAAAAAARDRGGPLTRPPLCGRGTAQPGLHAGDAELAGVH
jgi:hypothetical protein